MLRDYQKDICSRTVEAFWSHRSVMVQMPTGTGKTVVLVSLVKSLECGILVQTEWKAEPARTIPRCSRESKESVRSVE